MNRKISHIAVFTSGGDAPGMNACIRAVVRSARYNNIKASGIMRGYEGMIENEIIELKGTSVSNIIQRGGTILKSSRSERFRTEEGRKTAARNLAEAGIDGVIAIGGDGTFKGALAFQHETGIPFIGIPGTIDNDLIGTDNTLGYDTAINTVVDAVDKLRDTAASHDRLFVVEVMGRDAGLIALRSGIAVGAEAILVPETETDLDHVISLLEKRWEARQNSSIVIVAEGDEAGGAFEVAKKIKKQLSFFETRVSVLGHIQRGGSPTCVDRVLASRLGLGAVEGMMQGKSGVMAGIVNNKLVFTPFEQAVKHHKSVNLELLRVAEVLAT